MSLSLFLINVCSFNNCGLYFATLNDLIQHIEETHIPLIESELIKKEECEKSLAAAAQQNCDNSNENSTNYLSQSSASTNSLSQSSSSTINSLTTSTSYLPLSTTYKLFPALPPQKAHPIKYEPTKIAFCHYRKRPSPVSSVCAALCASGGGSSDKPSTPCRSEHDEEFSNDSFRNEDGDGTESGDTTLEERRHKCPVEGCNKRYKNLQGARYHARQVHGFTDDTAGRLTPIETLTSTPHSPLTQTSTSSKYANVRPYKCAQCSKRYKTVAGLNNHVQQTHQRVTTTGTQSLTSNLVPVSPSALSNSSTSHSHGSSTCMESSHSSSMSGGGGGKPMVTSNQMTMSAMQSSAHQSAISQPGGMRISTQPLQNMPALPTTGHQYHQQVSTATTPNQAITSTPSVTPTNIQMRTVGTMPGTPSRSGGVTMSESRMSFSGMADNPPQVQYSQSEQRSSLSHNVTPKIPQRTLSTGNLTVASRNQYQHSQMPVVHRVKMSTTGAATGGGGGSGGGNGIGSGSGSLSVQQVVNAAHSAQMPVTSSAASSPQTSHINRQQQQQQQQQIFQQQQQQQTQQQHPQTL